MKDKLSATQIISRINRPDMNSTDRGGDVLNGFDKETIISFLCDQYLGDADIESESLSLQALDDAKKALYHDIVEYKDTVGRAQSAIKWAYYGSSTLIAMLAALNIGSSANSNNKNFGGNTGTQVYSIIQLAVAIVAVGIIKAVSEPIIETRNEVITRLKVLRNVIDAEITKRRPPKTFFPPAGTSSTSTVFCDENTPLLGANGK